MDASKLYPRAFDESIIYLKNAITDKNITVGDYTIYNDYYHDPCDFEKNNVLYHYPINNDKLIIGKYCSIACNAKFMFTCGNHTRKSLANYSFPVFFDEFGIPSSEITSAWDNKGDIVIGNDVWIGYDAVIMQGVKIGDGAVIGTRALVTKDVAPYAVVGGVPAKVIKKRFSDEDIKKLLDLGWWNLPDEKVRELVPLIRSGNIDALLDAARKI